MTEKQKVLALAMSHFMYKAQEYRKSGDPSKIVSASMWDAAAIEIAGLGVSQEDIDSTIGKYISQIHTPYLHYEYFRYAVEMAQKGASKDVVEELVRFLTKNYCWIWALEGLVSLLGRKPAREEIFALVRLEAADMSCLSESHHEELLKFSKKHLSYNDVEKVREMLDGKIREWQAHPFD